MTWLRNINKDWNRIASNSALSISILLILFVYFSNRSLFLDGLNLARNIAEGSFIDLSQPLKYEQSAPILFLFLSKLITLVSGVSEYSLRLLPLVSGLTCLFIFRIILDKILTSKYIWIGILWLGTHAMFIRYATEYKQYMTDTFVTVFLIWLALKLDTSTKKNIFIIALAGTIAIWLSMPSIFVLAGLILYYLHIQRTSQNPPYPILFLAAWFIAIFTIEYFLILRPAIESSHMQNFHQNYFIQGKVWNASSLQHDLGLFIGMIRMAVGKSGLAIAVAVTLIFVSLYDFMSNKRNVGLLIVTPILAMFGASLLGKYSLIERLMLFVLPLLVILILIGLQISVEWLKGKKLIYKYSVLGIIGISLLVGYSQTQGFKYIFDPLEIEDNRSSLVYISIHEKHLNPIICTQHAYPSYSYYTVHDENLKGLTIGMATAAKYGESVIELAKKQSTRDKTEVWILMGHMLDHEITDLISDLDKAGTIKNSYRTNRSAAILFSTQ